MGGVGKDGQAYREEVAVTTIDHFAAEEGLRRLDFIKMDVEGWEMRILEGGAATIERFRPVMLIELVEQQLTQAGDSLEAAWGLLDSWGYRPAVCSDGKTLTPREEPLEGDNFGCGIKAPCRHREKAASPGFCRPFVPTPGRCGFPWRAREGPLSVHLPGSR